MNEKEKKAIERMQEVRDKNVHTFVDELTIVLNLIEKQQNRIYELEKALIDEDLKYRDKIKQLKDKLKEDINKFSNNKNEVFMTQSSQIDASLISYCNELLDILEE